MVLMKSGSTAKFDKKQWNSWFRNCTVFSSRLLRHNIDVTVGLVNGAIGTVMGIYSTRISIKFDHINVPCDIEG